MCTCFGKLRVLEKPNPSNEKAGPMLAPAPGQDCGASRQAKNSHVPQFYGLVPHSFQPSFFSRTSCFFFPGFSVVFQKASDPLKEWTWKLPLEQRIPTRTQFPRLSMSCNWTATCGTRPGNLVRMFFPLKTSGLILYNWPNWDTKDLDPSSARFGPSFEGMATHAKQHVNMFSRNSIFRGKMEKATPRLLKRCTRIHCI